MTVPPIVRSIFSFRWRGATIVRFDMHFDDGVAFAKLGPSGEFISFSPEETAAFLADGQAVFTTYVRAA